MLAVLATSTVLIAGAQPASATGVLAPVDLAKVDGADSGLVVAPDGVSSVVTEWVRTSGSSR